MAPAQIAIPAPLRPSTPPSTFRHARDDLLQPDESSIKTVDALVRHRARRDPHVTIVSYPSSGVDFVDYTMQQLDVFAYRVARHYQTFIPTRSSSAETPTTVAVLGPSNMDYIVSMLALTKLGHTVLFLSTRISQAAIDSLITTTGATYLLADSRYARSAIDAQRAIPGLQIGEIARPNTYNFPVEVHADTRLDYQLDHTVEASNNIYIIHSSGSTGLPKPIYQPQRSAIANYAISMNMKAFITLPLYHNHGICNFFRAIYSGKSIHIYNADLPLTQSYLATILRQHRFEIFYGVPYALKLLSETDEGIGLLKQLKIVMYGGSACPDALGDLLVNSGVNLVGHYGATEVGQLMTSFRPADDKVWNYVRESPKLSPYLRWVSRGPNLYECTVLPGWPAKVASNLPDGSYATKDLFEPHPTIEKAWKYIARLDDTIVLVNGEKFNPVMMEGTIRSHRAVTETVVFGSGRPYLGVLVVPAIEGMPKSKVVDEIWPVIEAANQTAEAYARISRDMVQILPYGCQFPRTDKGSVIRQQFYKQYANEIDNAYDAIASAQGDLKTWTVPELEDFLRTVLAKHLTQAGEIERTADFFSLGLDSLQSIQIRTEILKNVNIGDKKLGQNVVFDHPSIASLAAHLDSLRTGQEEQVVSVTAQMQDLLAQYSNFEPIARRQAALTGATGSLGAHVLVQLLHRSDIDIVYCLVRAKDYKTAARRVRESLIQRKLYHTLSLSGRRKIQAIPSDLSEPHLGFDHTTYARVASGLTSVIHCAWSVNFNKNLISFEKDCIAGVRHLIDLCLASTSTKPASFDFCSSVSTVARCPDMRTPERLAEFDWAQGMGYAQSKCVAEHLCLAAAKETGVKARVLRVGQIVADTVHGVWNSTEAIPLMMQSALTVGALPRLQEFPSWTPVDVVAKAVTEISLSDAGSIVANVTNAKTFSWTDDLLPALREAGLQFDEVEPKEWVRRLRESNQDAVANPPIKLADFFASKYDKDVFGPSRTYDTTVARSFSPSLDTAPVLDVAFVKTFVRQFQSAAWQIRTTSVAKPMRRVVVVVAGPCGSGKSTVARRLGAHFKAPYIEGDELHTEEAIVSMAAGTPLNDVARAPWLARVRQRALDTVTKEDHERVLVSCSALKKSYRDEFRILVDEKIQVVFVDLQVEPEELVRRTKGRGGHYMKENMVESQMAIWETADVSETDVVPVDAGQCVEEVVEEISGLLEALDVM
ncbi:putative NRPS-like protein biosynthetic cluster [Alternaria metachromatica]|uniref:putative NRPS-like protein biosynthetic cluster n=1 Tax=Alternaria metachromatica TaxID=283354 RepID=UPI0020C4E682|nr:putative NRPS-like protein biosynthetic cluster [Alternaria metachromatica]KAI4612274.1 putative NRPS-like protein biosynthetic cluster [Alternaria metachromatica]